MDVKWENSNIESLYNEKKKKFEKLFMKCKLNYGCSVLN